ncbi:MAG: hypothetical protein AB2814_08370 [Candidatus Sedimenticola endophacoides]
MKRVITASLIALSLSLTGCGDQPPEESRESVQARPSPPGQQTPAPVREIGTAPDLGEQARELGANAWDKTRQATGELVDKTVDTSRDLYQSAREKGGDIGEKTMDKSKELWDATKEKSGEIWDTTRERAKEYYDSAKDKALELYEKAQPEAPPESSAPVREI